VLSWLREVQVKAPALLARTEIDDGHALYPVIVTYIEGQLLAEAPFPPRGYLPSLFAQIHQIHRVTTDRGAAPIGEMTNGEPSSWKAYLLRILTGDDPDFQWDLIQRDARFVRDTLTREITRAMERVERLPEPDRPGLLHGDLNPHNIFVDRHEVVGIVDWSYARFGDPLFDFARLHMNPSIRGNPAALRDYFRELAPGAAAREREQTYYLFNLLEYVNWYYLDHEFARVREQLRLIAREIEVWDH
jgi:aminoglycoside phosphotransferase (APT) family kinase protein